MNGFIAVLGDWHFWALAISYYAFISFVGGMPEPMPNGSRGYLWCYNSLHLFSGNVSRLVQNRLNGNSKGSEGKK